MSRSLPLASGTPYDDGTTTARLVENIDGIVLVEATFGNVFSETVIPMTLAAAADLRDALDRALRQSEIAR